jgi:hypothetical protein
MLCRTRMVMKHLLVACVVGLAALSPIACSDSVPTGTTVTTSARVESRGGLGSGEACVRDVACQSGYCDHPVGFCAAPGICRDLLGCMSSPHVVVGGRCVRAWYGEGAPGACKTNLEESYTRHGPLPRFGNSSGNSP